MAKIVVALLFVFGMALPARADTPCTRVIGFSQVDQWYEAGFESYVPDSEWELFWHFGGRVNQWVNPDGKMWTQGALVSPCAGPVTRVVFNVAPGKGTLPSDVPRLTAGLQRAITTVRSKFPGLPIILQPLTGGPGGGLCYLANGILVNATYIQPFAIQAIAATGLPTGATPQADCSWFRDETGHFTPAGMTSMAAQLGAWWG